MRGAMDRRGNVIEGKRDGRRHRVREIVALLTIVVGSVALVTALITWDAAMRKHTRLVVTERVV